MRIGVVQPLITNRPGSARRFVGPCVVSQFQEFRIQSFGVCRVVGVKKEFQAKFTALVFPELSQTLTCHRYLSGQVRLKLCLGLIGIGRIFRPKSLSNRLIRLASLLWIRCGQRSGYPLNRLSIIRKSLGKIFVQALPLHFEPGSQAFGLRIDLAT